ncbi:MFS monocarboxylate transporter [Aspergillus minisclerotigenes]|uniref:MFS monocarboxylate transporter n=1 Tax=Aspergillus minisclerotigenes TaxID=656917 RepID=A0A5N6IQB8_9EURO|nr:MFS monocarboxylate transporter [Aspergillus minisclerotigenes]
MAMASTTRRASVYLTSAKDYFRAQGPKWRPAIVVASSFTIVFTCCGLIFAWGVYQALYERLAREPGTPFTGATPAEIDLIGTISVSLMTIGAPFTVAWAKRFTPSTVAFGTALWHFELTQGFLNGIGTCLSYMVAVTTAPTWFTRHRGLAMGIILSGTGVGGLVWTPALNACVDRLGFRKYFVGAMAWEPSTKARIETENSARTSRADGILKVPLVDWRVAKSRKFVAQALGAVFQSAAYYTPVFFYASYAQTLGYGTTASSNFIALSNACNAIGKIIIGHLADRVGRLNALFITTLLSAISAVAFWLPSTCLGETTQSQGLFITFTVFYGVFASAYVSLFPTSLIELFGAQKLRFSNDLGPEMFRNMSLLVSALLFAATGAVLWVRVEAMVGPNGGVSWKWLQ